MATSEREAKLGKRVHDLGFTPGVRDLADILALLATDDDALARDAERAVLRIEQQYRARVIETVVETAERATRPARGRLARLIGELAQTTEATSHESALRARTWLTSAIRDADPKTRRTAARALGKGVLARPDRHDEALASEHAAVVTRLLEAWDATDDDDDRKAFAEALGRLGAKSAKERLHEQSARSDSGVTTARRAELMIDRAISRETPGRVDLARSPEQPVAVRFHARVGLEAVVSEELGSVWPHKALGPGWVDTQLTRALSEATKIRTASHLGFPLAPSELKGDLGEAIARAIVSKPALSLFRTFTTTTGPIRFRLAFQDGKRRANVAWRCAELVRERTNELVNDPTESTWEVVADVRGSRLSIELVPRGFDDARFAYRKALVPASSHPTLAAAIARLAPRSKRDVVWDPFVGAGAELIERALLGPYAALHGTDMDARALEAAATNLQHAHIERVTLTLTDALTYAPAGVDVILSNPPMGRRVQRGAHGELLERFVAHAGRVLRPGGALVWAVPEAAHVHARAEREGFSIERCLTIDMGGFPADLCVYRKGQR